MVISGVEVKMVMAFVMVNIGPTEQQDEYAKDWLDIVKKQIEQIDNVIEAHHIFGRYDLILKVEAKDPDEISKVVDDIRSLSSVTATETFITHI